MFQPEPPPTPTVTKENLDRTNDHVYESTTSVVRSVMALTQKAPTVRPDEFVDLVKVPYCFRLSNPTTVTFLILEIGTADIITVRVLKTEYM